MQRIERGTRPYTREQASATTGEGVLPSRHEAHRLIIRAAWGAAVLLMVLAAGFLAFGCGQQSNDRVSSAPQPATAVAAQAQPGATLPASTTGSGNGTREPNSEALAAASTDSLSPDVAASVSDTPVVPGTAIEITAEGSPDVVAVTLGDDSGSKQAFAYDSSADLWRAAYRVPVKIKNDRPALSVTARNASGRWRRVYVFLEVAGNQAQVGGWLSRPGQGEAADTVATGHP
jgi:hypothetical protein